MGVSASDVSIAAYGTDTGFAYQFGADDDFDTASIVKVDILAALLLQHQDDGTVIADGTPAAALADARVQELISGTKRAAAAQASAHA